MRLPDINDLARAFATAAGFCFIAKAITFELLRNRGNEQLPRERKIPWYLAAARRNKVIAEYKVACPHGWEYRAYRIFQVLWVTFVILAVLALFFGSSA